MIAISIGTNCTLNFRLPPVPLGFAFLVDDDGAYLTDGDGAYLIDEVA